MDHLSIRHYIESDWAQVSKIHDLARPIELQGSCDPDAFVPLADDKDDLAQFNHCQKLVVTNKNVIAGFIGIEGDEVGWLYVDPKFSRQGIGRLLLREAIHRMGTTIFVHVLSGNTAALNLYLSEGFLVTDTFTSQNNGYPCTVQKLERR